MYFYSIIIKFFLTYGVLHMNKVYSKLLLGILVALCIAAIAAYLKLQTQGYNYSALGIALIISLSVLCVGIVGLVVHIAFLSQGFSVKSTKDQDIEDIQDKVSVFLPVSEENLNNINSEYNITDITCSLVPSTSKINTLNITQTLGITSKKKLEVPLDTSQNVKILHGSQYTELNKSGSGICIVTDANKRTVLQEFNKMTLAKVRYPIIKQNGSISLVCKGIKIFPHKTHAVLSKDDISFFQRNFENILKSQIDIVDDRSGTLHNRTLYDIILEHILTENSVDKLINGNWNHCDQAKLLYAFFSIFNFRGTDNSKLSQLGTQVINFVKQNGEYTNEYFTKQAFNLVAKYYIRLDSQFSMYNRLYNNPFISPSGRRLSDTLRSKMKLNSTFRLICAIAIQDTKLPINNKTNEFLSNLLKQENYENAITKASKIVGTSKAARYFSRVAKCEDSELSSVLNELLSGYSSFSSAQLISAARSYIVNFCKEHALIYFDIYRTIDMGNIDKIILHNPNQEIDNVLSDPNLVSQNAETKSKMHNQ
ncbi:hypothetical protein FDZ58_02025 [Ehrlichia ruminantium]|nr:hypothetical protein AUR40_00915 [Ehrlichia ruminantium]QLK50438.1 hypothetical protein FDZ68_02015 [Ehrlichia ruminantium]QLK51363.1 hypothetical protein FDZ66_02020 [Ehrlichia ruminantium]QLK58700.1 hypothetical protein FDZ58_02025 [Ehrlichia ruminantium]